MIEIKFTFEDHEREELNQLLDSQEALLAYREVIAWCRKLSKYEDVRTIEVEELRDKLYEIANEYGIGKWL